MPIYLNITIKNHLSSKKNRSSHPRHSHQHSAIEVETFTPRIVAMTLANDFADVVPPDDDGADCRTACARPVVSPRTGEVIGRAGVVADLRTHIPAAPCGGPTRIVLTSASMVVMRPSLCARSDQTKYCRCSHENTHHGCSLLRRRSRYAIKTSRWWKGTKKRQAAGEMSGLKSASCV